jgi:signal transduction histidine kinase
MRKRSLSHVIFVNTAFITAAVLIFTSVVAFVLIRNSLSQAFHSQQNSIQRLFVDSIADDILTGAYSEAYRKCVSFFENPVVQAVDVKSTSGDSVCSLVKNDSIAHTVKIATPVYFDESKSESAAIVDVAYSEQAMVNVWNQSIVILLVAVVLAVLLSLFIIRSASKKLTQPIRLLSERLSAGDLQQMEDLSGISKDNSVSEISSLFRGIEQMSKTIIESQKVLLYKKGQEVELALAKQVAHDIRSPLTALNAVLDCVPNMPDDARRLVKSAVGRIMDITTKLLSQHRKNIVRASVPDPNESVSVKEPELISQLIEQIVAEKRVQIQADKRVEIDAAAATRQLDVFACVDRVEFCRALSNTLNNAVEAIDREGKITISLKKNGTDIILLIEDSGKGIPADVLERLGKFGQTFGKADGSGLGLFHAESTMKSIGGRVELKSKVGAGTSVRLIFPTSKPPDWYFSKLDLEQNSTVVIVDDDPSIHEAWATRLASFKNKHPMFRVFNFSSIDEFKVWFGTEKIESQNIKFLFDYEVLGSRQTGLEVIDELGIGKYAVLITSHSEEKAIRKKCSELGAGLIPKGMLGHIPIDMEGA